MGIKPDDVYMGIGIILILFFSVMIIIELIDIVMLIWNLYNSEE